MKRHPSPAVLENGIYALIWLIVALIPLFGYYDAAEGIHWKEVIRFWQRVVPFFVLFLVNNYLLTRYFLTRKRSGLYVVVMLAFVIVLFVVAPALFGRQTPRPIPRFVESPTAPPVNLYKGLPFLPGWSDVFPEEMRPILDRRPPWHPTLFKWERLFNDCLLALLLIGFNIAIRLLFQSMQDARRLRELESQNLKAELQYLKMQVNPHFFMNTLNNIHALIDIDAERAKETVIDLSRIMRYVLYDADRPMVPLRKEVEFIGNYIELMLPRYRPELLDLRTAYPAEIPDVQIPPLLLVTLIENAFKHGISYRHPSFIHTELTLEQGWIVYTVCNSTTDKPASSNGVGLEILRRRLSLLYEGKQTFSVEQQEGTFRATLRIPIEYAHTLYSD